MKKFLTVCLQILWFVGMSYVVFAILKVWLKI